LSLHQALMPQLGCSAAHPKGEIPETEDTATRNHGGVVGIQSGAKEKMIDQIHGVV